jgi:hypothetical protein
MEHNPISKIGIADRSIINDEESKYSPLIVFILICFFSLTGTVIYKSLTTKIPSVCTFGVESGLMILGCSILLVVGAFSVKIEWFCLVILTLCVLLSIYAIIDPDVFFYPALS